MRASSHITSRRLPDEQYLADCVQAEREPSFAGLLRLARAGTEPSTVGQADGQSLLAPAAAAEPLFPEAQCSALLAIPPWHGCNSPDHSPLTTDQLCELAVGRLCQQRAHLYLWTGSRYLLDGFDLTEAWGFTYETAFVCVYEDVQPDTPWSAAHHLLLLGTQGDLPFRENESSARSWLLCKRPENGLIPQEIRDLIEATSPAPYGQVFGSESAPNADWTVYPTSPA